MGGVLYFIEQPTGKLNKVSSSTFLSRYRKKLEIEVGKTIGGGEKRK